MGIKLTKRQSEIFEFIKTCIVDNGMPPTIREIGNRFKFSSLRTVQVHLETLEKKGWIRRKNRHSRGLELVDSISRGVPILGHISAGIPLEAEENYEGEIPCEHTFFGKEPHFALQVNGDSMTGAGILDGDFCIVRQQETAKESEIVAAIVSGEATVKRLVKNPDRTWVLRPENSSYKDIIFSADSFSICGVVVGVWRDLS